MFSPNLVDFEGEYLEYLTEKDAGLGGKRQCKDGGGI
jgi:hypothetical protein